MNNKERAIQLIEQIPESKMYYIIAFLEGAAIPDEIPNSDTAEAIDELLSGGGTAFKGSTSDFISSLLED